jgi:hypothetical protein
MLETFDHMEAQQFARTVLTKMGLTQMSEVFPEPSGEMTHLLRKSTAEVIQTVDPVQRATILRLFTDREYRSLVCNKRQ